MKKIETGSIQHLILLVVAMIIAGLIIDPLFSYLYLTFITHSTFVYTAQEYVMQPINWGLFLGFITWWEEKERAKKNNEK